MEELYGKILNLEFYPCRDLEEHLHLEAQWPLLTFHCVD